MLSNQKQNIKSSLYNVISKWIADNEEEIHEAFETPWSEYVTELMASSAFNILCAQEDMTRYYEKEKMDFSE